MAPGRKRLRQLQFGKETSAGTATTATSLWRGMVNGLDDQQVVEEIEEMIGILDGADRTAVTKLMAGLEFLEAPLTFEQFNIPLVAGFGGLTTGASDGSGSDKVYTATVPTTAAPTVAPYTLYVGDDSEVERMEYAFPTKLSISGVAGETAKVSSTWLGRQITTSAFASGLTLPTVEEALTAKGRVYSDAIGGTFGSTQVASQILAFKLDFEFMWIPKFTMDGNLYFTLPVYTGHKISGSLTFEHDTAVKRSGGAKSYWAAQTARKLRIDLVGSSVTTAGSTYSTKHVIFDLPLKYTKAGVLGDQDGNDIVVMDFRSRYNATATTAGAVIVVNELTTNF